MCRWRNPADGPVAVAAAAAEAASDSGGIVVSSSTTVVVGALYNSRRASAVISPGPFGVLCGLLASVLVLWEAVVTVGRAS